MDEFDPEVVRLLVTYLYTGSYVEGFRQFWTGQNTISLELLNIHAGGELFARGRSADGTWQQQDTTPSAEMCDLAWRTVRLHTRMDAIAEYYNIPGLHEEALSELIGALSIAMRDKSQAGADVFLEILQEVQDTNGNLKIQEIIADLSVDYLPVLLQNEEYKARFKKGYEFALVESCAARLGQ